MFGLDGKGAPRSGIRPQAGGLRRGPWRIVHPDGLLCGERPLRDPAGRIVAGERWRHGRSAALRSVGPGGWTVRRHAS
ncbi:MAG: hypothetical protein F4020_03105 [Gammaproteobacteria bacterium]|nr:hypothetical protein [Gammaproteobacteria bacterium]